MQCMYFVCFDGVSHTSLVIGAKATGDAKTKEARCDEGLGKDEGIIISWCMMQSVSKSIWQVDEVEHFEEEVEKSGNLCF